MTMMLSNTRSLGVQVVPSGCGIFGGKFQPKAVGFPQLSASLAGSSRPATKSARVREYVSVAGYASVWGFRYCCTDGHEECMAHPKKSATQHRKNKPRNRLGFLDIPLSLVFVKAFSSSFVFAL